MSWSSVFPASHGSGERCAEQAATSRRAGAGLGLLLLALLTSTISSAQLAPVGEDAAIAPSAEGLPLSQFELAVLEDGSIVQAWIADRNQSGTGTPEPRLWLRITNTAGIASAPRRVPTGSGTVLAFSRLALATDGSRIALAWEAARELANGTHPEGIYLATFDTDLTLISGAQLISGSGPRARRLPRLAANRDELVVAFTAFVPLPSFSDVFARRLGWNGQPRGGAFQVNEDPEKEQFLEDVVLFDNGDALFSWFDIRGGESALGDIFARRFDADNRPLGPSFRASQEEGGLGTRQENSSMAVLLEDRVVITWESTGDLDLDSLAVYARLVERDGSLGPPFIVHEEHALDQANPDVAPLLDGGFLVVWHDTCLQASSCFDQPGPQPSRDGSLSGVYGRVFDSQGVARGGDFHLAQMTQGDQSAPRVASAVRGSHSTPHLLGNEPASGNGLVVGWRTRAISPALFAYRRVEAPCQPALGVACVGAADRFRLTMNRRTPDGVVDLARAREEPTATPLDWGAFSFFDRANLDAVVRLLDARHLNGAFWIFFASLSDVEFELQVLDTSTGLRRGYFNPAGSLASFGDVNALPGALAGAGADTWRSPGRLVANRVGVSDTAACDPHSDRLCLGGRFTIEVQWTDFVGTTGSGRALPLERDTGGFWFFDPRSPDLVIKVLDGRAINGHWWVFAGSLSNVAFSIVVTDTVTGAQRFYGNPTGVFASFADIEAFVPVR